MPWETPPPPSHQASSRYTPATTQLLQYAVVPERLADHEQEASLLGAMLRPAHRQVNVVTRPVAPLVFLLPHWWSPTGHQPCRR